MARRVWPIAVLTALIAMLAGCSNYERPRRPAWRTQAENACIAQNLIRPSIFVQPAREIDGPGICGLTRPFRVSALLDGAVRFNANYLLDCPMIAALNAWVKDVVQPSAAARFGQPVAQIDGMGAYSCRGMNNQRGARLSEHAFGNAIDIGGFRLADGREILIVRDWTRGDDQARAFLQDVHAGGCAHFTTVLGPGANIFHYNHIHVDLAMHGNSSTGARRICRPAPQAAPLPQAPRDGLPDPPDFEDDLEVAQGKAAPGAEPPEYTQVGPGPGPVASIPPTYAPAPRANAYAPIPPQPIGVPTRGNGAFAQDGNPRDWDVTSTIPRR